MDEKEPLLKRILKIYEKARSWIIYGAIIALAIGFYFGDAFGPRREEILVALALGILAILFAILLEISRNLKIKPAIEVFPSLYDALPRIREIIGRDKKETSVKIIAATGGTTLDTILPAIRESSPAGKIKISMGILAPDTPSKEYIPPHWIGEIETTIQRVEDFRSKKRVSLDLFLFDMLPVPHGLILNDEHLFLGFFSWTTTESGKSQLSGAQLPHYYYHKSHPEYEYYRELFESWFNYSPRRN